MWKTRPPAWTEVSSQECQVQGMSQNRTFQQSVPEQEKSQPVSQSYSEPPRQ